MTNADKYLKEGVSVYKLASELYKFTNDIEEKHKYLKGMIQDFFNTPIPPTLTEDERVILRNIDVKNYDIIGKNSLGVTFITSTKDSDKFIWVNNVFAKKLFQFIKERRRIRDKGVVRR